MNPLDTPSSGTDVNRRPRPSPLQLALALAVVKSKPDDVSVREYILQIRASLRPGTAPRTASSPRHMDQIAWWKAEVERVMMLNADLQRRNADLHMKLEAADARPPARSPPSGPSPSNTKRKVEPSGRTHAQATSIKRMRSGQSVTENEGRMCLEILLFQDDNTLKAFGEDGQLLLEHVFFVHKLCKEANFRPQELAFHLVKSATQISSILATRNMSSLSDAVSGDRKKTLLPGPVKARRNAISDIAVVLRPVARAFTSLLLGLSRLARVQEGQGFCGNVIYAFIKIFRQILSGIEKTSSARATIDITSQNAESGSSQKKKPKAQPKAVLSKESEVCSALCQLLNAMMSSLDPSEAVHRDVFEGFMYVLIERLGDRLFVCTFGVQRSATLEDDILRTMENTSEQQLRRLKEMRKMSYEAPSLVSILQRALSVAPQYLEQPTAHPRSATKPTSAKQAEVANTSTTASSKASLSLMLKERLQNTLVACAFGEETIQSLRKPLPSKKTLRPPSKIQAEDSFEWFKQEIWRMVGWDILSREPDELP